MSELRQFVAVRDWAKFHTPGNLAKSVAIEAGELLECFQWNEEPDLVRLKEELADVLIYCHLLADKIGADVSEIMSSKLAINEAKYPVEKAFGTSEKYDRL